MRIPRPIIKYHGSKWRIAPWIIEQFPPHGKYVEPFCGGAAVLFRKPRSPVEVINDLSDDLVNLFRVLRSPMRAKILAYKLWATPYSRRDYELSLIPTRRPIERARRLIARSRMGWGSSAQITAGKTGYRSNLGRAKNTPGEAVWAKIPNEILLYTERLRGVNIEHRDALEVIAQHDSDQTLFYIDPPYMPEARKAIKKESRTTKMYKHDLVTADHEKLLAALKTLKGMVVVSGYPSELYDSALAGWRRMERSSFDYGMNERTEVIWLSPNIPTKRRELF